MYVVQDNSEIQTQRILWKDDGDDGVSVGLVCDLGWVIGGMDRLGHGNNILFEGLVKK